MIPKSLKKGDTIGVVSPSNALIPHKKEKLLKGIKKLENLGFKLICSKNCFKIDEYELSAGSPKERADDLNEMFSNPHINAIYCSIGGYTANQILPLIDFDNIKKIPKFLWV